MELPVLRVHAVDDGLALVAHLPEADEFPHQLGRAESLKLPEGSRLISVMRNGSAEIAVGATTLEAGDQVLAILEPGKEDELRKVLLRR